MHCPFCRHNDSKVVDSRTSDDGTSIRRRRRCTECGRRFSTLETTSISVIKRSGVTEPFDRQKIVNGVRKACQGRPVSEDDLAMLAQEVEESIRASGSAEVEAHDVGLAILPPLRRLDVVAYLRFASVYQAFEGLEDFERAIVVLRDQQAELAGQQTLVPPASRPSSTQGRRRPARRSAQDPVSAVSRGTAVEGHSDRGTAEGGTPVAGAPDQGTSSAGGHHRGTPDASTSKDGAPDRGAWEPGSTEQTGTREDPRTRGADRAETGSGEKPVATRRRRAKKPADTVTQPRLL